MKKLGFGFKRLPLVNKKDIKSIDLDRLNGMVDLYIEKGFNYFDTSYISHNGMSEVAIHKAVINRYPRESVILADKLPTMSVDGSYDLEEIFNKQLERCGVDYFDYYMIDIDSFSEKKLVKDESFTFIENKKHEGKIKNIGICFSGKPKDLDGLLDKHPEVDVLQLPLNYFDWDNFEVSSGNYYNVARKHGKDIIVMDPYKGRTLIDLPETVIRLYNNYDNKLSNASWAVRFLASLDGVIMVVSDMSKIEHVADNVGYMVNFKPITDEEKEIINRGVRIIKSRMEIPCVGCLQCLDVCPMDILIPNYLNLFNTYRMSSGLRNYSQKRFYQTFVLNKKYRGAYECIGCDNCIDVCSKHIDIPKVLKAVSFAFDDYQYF